jgi:hypothetical protein
LTAQLFIQGIVGRAAGIDRQRIETTADSRIGAEQCDGTELPLCFRDQVPDILLIADIGPKRSAADGSRNGFGPLPVKIRDHDLRRAFAMEDFGQRLADAVGASGDDDDFALHVHALILRLGNRL